MWQAIALSFGLAMDASAVSAARGLAGTRRDLIALPLLFGAFQSGMAALGWLAGTWVGPYIARWQSWVAFALLAAIGGKMIYEAVKGSAELEAKPPGLMTDLLLALATSIDAAAAGLTLPQLGVSPVVAIVLIGTITAACSAAAFVAGRALGDRLGAKLEVLGGVVLIGIGAEMLIRGL